MNIRTVSIALVLFAVVITSEQTAAAEGVRVSVNPAIVYPVNFEGKKTKPQSGNYLTLAFPIVPRWSLSLKGGFATPFDTVQPAPHGVIGLGWLASDAFGIAVGAGYMHIPHWDGTPSGMHVLTTGLVPFIPVNDRITLAFPIGPAYNATTKTWSGAIALEVGFRIGGK